MATVLQLIEQIGGLEDGVPVGVCFPAIVKHGRTMSAANVSKKWIGLEAEALFEKGIGRDIHFVNDADAAGYAEAKYGAAKGVEGVVLLTTLGTGIGSALIHDGVLVPNTELGHLQVRGQDAETSRRVLGQGTPQPQLGGVDQAPAGVLHATSSRCSPPTCSSSVAGCRRTTRTSFRC